MKKFFNYVRSDRIILYSTQGSLLLLLLATVYALFFYFRLPPFLPLFNQLPWGDTRIGTRIQLFIPIGITLSVFLVNSVIAARFYDKTPLLSRMLFIIALLICLFVFLFIIRTIHLVV